MKLDFQKDYYLENENIRLEPLDIIHLNDLLKVSVDKSIWKYFFLEATDVNELRKYISNAIENRNLELEYPFAIFDKKTNQFIGCTRLFNYSNQFKTIKIGHSWIGVNFQGTRVNKNSKFLLFQFLFDQLELERIGFGVHSENIQSIKALESVGCKKEGELRSMFPNLDQEGRADAILMSILKTEWDSSIKQTLKNKLL